jgi:glycosyltransferase involved in cell wall biosynthesis
MQGSAYHITEHLIKNTDKPDVILISDMVDLALLKSLNPQLSDVPFVLYMHENQLTYPFSQLDKQKHLDLSYGYLNYKSCLAADKVLFNSNYHMDSFINACAQLLHKMPDFNNLKSITNIRSKSSIMPIGLDLKYIDTISPGKKKNESPVILWNHRWAHDKNPDIFLALLKTLKKKKLTFSLILTLPNVDQNSPIYQQLIQDFAAHILFAGYAESYEDYITLLKKSDFLPVCSSHDFFGLSVLEAIYCGNTPILPKNMVYSEHFNELVYSDLYYDNYIQLEEKLVHSIKHFNSPKAHDLAVEIYRYQMSGVIVQYEKFFESLR